jgi:hypothetical protein
MGPFACAVSSKAEDHNDHEQNSHILCHVMSLCLCRTPRSVQLLVSPTQPNKTPLPQAPTITAAAKNKKALQGGPEHGEEGDASVCG